jgi:alanyl-tRNA synthetase
MKSMTSREIRKRFIDYFINVLAAKGLAHVEVASSSLIPENHPTLLFTNSGMVQFTPYFLGIKDPVQDFKSKRLCSVQKSLRTGDLDIVGISKYHLTYFEMLGSWSIGDYGKSTAVELAFDLLTNKEYGFGLDASKFYPTVFEGNEEAPFDEETYNAWKKFLPENKICKLPASENWWAPGPVGPCGPCTEILYDRGAEFGPEEEVPGMTDNPRYLEIWNAGVFMQYNRQQDGRLEPLKTQSVDTGAGLERFAVLLQGVDSVYESDVFSAIINEGILPQIDRNSLLTVQEELKKDKSLVKSAVQRVADHMRAATMLMAEGVFPSNKDQGYVLRRLIRKSFDACVWSIGMDSSKIPNIVEVIVSEYKDIYPELNKLDQIKQVLTDEINAYKAVADNTRKFIQSNYSKKGLKIIDNPFDIYQSVGASKELIGEVTKELGLEVNFTKFDEELFAHQEKSKANQGERFKGGLGDHSIETTKLHTATHLLHQALRDVLGDSVRQMGSNITPERLRFDFSHDEKMTEEQIRKVEQIVNEKIAQKLAVNKIVLSKVEAEKSGALHFFKDKYGDEVNVYYIGDSLENAWSKEFCGGPHVANLSELGKFTIQKEEAVGKGVRRIKAVLC